MKSLLVCCLLPQLPYSANQISFPFSLLSPYFQTANSFQSLLQIISIKQKADSVHLACALHSPETLYCVLLSPSLKSYFLQFCSIYNSTHISFFFKIHLNCLGLEMYHLSFPIIFKEYTILIFKFLKCQMFQEVKSTGYSQRSRVPFTAPMSWLIAICNSSSKGAAHSDTQMYKHNTHAHKIIFKKIQKQSNLN